MNLLKTSKILGLIFNVKGEVKMIGVVLFIQSIIYVSGTDNAPSQYQTASLAVDIVNVSLKNEESNNPLEEIMLPIFELRKHKRSTKGRKIDDSRCSIKFYKVKYYDDPTPLEFFRGKRYAYLKEKSIRTIGTCCWKVFRKRNFRRQLKRSKNKCRNILNGNGEYPTFLSWHIREGKIKSFRKVPCPKTCP